MPRERPAVVSTRLRPEERALVRALAAAEGTTVSDAVQRVLIPAVRERLAKAAREPVEAEK